MNIFVVVSDAQLAARVLRAIGLVVATILLFIVGVLNRTARFFGLARMRQDPGRAQRG